MKVEFLECKFIGKAKLNSAQIKQLPKDICIGSSIQFIDLIPEIKKQTKGKLIKTNNSTYKGQVLGCSKIKNNCKNLLYIGDGNFHAWQLRNEFEGNIFTFNPFNKKLSKVVSLDKYKKRQKGMLLKFLNSNTIGVIISKKPGQRYGDINKLIKKYPDKKFYKFVFDTIDYQQLNNFNFIDIWVNTACPRIGFEDSYEFKLSLINVEEII
jgi:diphthamide biosynthesis enzyme Dph1/Dph2-like protein